MATMLVTLLVGMLVSAGVVVVIIVHACVVGRFSSNLAEAEDSKNLIKGVSADELEKLPFYVYKGGEKGKVSEEECVFCLDGFQVGDRCRLLPICRHSFHANCVDSWLMKTAICPICRRSLSISTVSGNQLRDLESGGEEFELQEIGVV